MDFREIRDIVEQGKGKVIIVEGDYPVLVAMSYEEYKKSFLDNSQRIPEVREANTRKTREYDTVLPPEDSIRSAPQAQRNEGQASGELTIDDLPL